MKLSPNAQKSLKIVIQKFESGDLSPISQVARIRLDKSAPARNWTLSNRVLAFIQTEELDCRGFRQWQEVGRQIKKGSKAAYIIRPHTVKKTEDDKEEVVCVGFSSVAVFPASSTEGEQLPKYAPVELPPLLDIAKKHNIEVNFVPVAGDRLGDCTIEGDKIRVGTHDARVFFHELAHALHAKVDGNLKGGQQVDQETIAEFTAAVLMDIYDLGDNTGNAWKYISQYADDPLVAITKALATVEKILALINE